MKGLAAGKLRERVTILNPIGTDNNRGGRKTVFADGDTVWAEVIALRGDEALAQGIQRSTQLWRVTIRIRGDVTPKQRLRWGSILMDIKTAAPNETRDGLVMTTESGAVG